MERNRATNDQQMEQHGEPLRRNKIELEWSSAVFVASSFATTRTR